MGQEDTSYIIYHMTKLHDTETPAENLYNASSVKTRNVVERQYGVWKRRFPVLSISMRLKLETIIEVIVATAVLQRHFSGRVV